MISKIEKLITKKSLLGMPSKRDGLIQPSVTSQPPRLTAFTGPELGGTLPQERDMIEKRTTELSSHVLELKAIGLFMFVCVVCQASMAGKLI